MASREELMREALRLARQNVAAAGFDDARPWGELARAPSRRAIPAEPLLAEEGRGPFAAWAAKPDRTPY